MNDTTQKIAAEAVEKYFATPVSAKGQRADLLSIIQSAIEKVDEKWRERFRKFEKIENKFGPAIQRAAHASEGTLVTDYETGFKDVIPPAQPFDEFKAAKHHPSCKVSDQDLMWVCAQCGVKVDASSPAQ